MHDSPRLRALPSRRGSAPILALIAITAVLLAACGGSSSPKPSPVDLQGTTWRAFLVRDAVPVAGAEPTITFDGDQAGGTTGCNSYGGGFRLGTDGSFRMDSMIMTEMACDGPRGDQEGVVIDILSHADRLQIVGDELRISGPSGSITFAEDPR